MSVFDAQEQSKAGIFVNAAGQGVVFADVKNFVMDHPGRADKKIVYASLEGPEAAAYLRGTARLANGETQVTFPQHFQYVINSNTMTVVLTPLSADSKGLAVIDKSENGFVVKELQKGNGNYAFDWEVKAVRSGYENYIPVRDSSEFDSAKREEDASDSNAALSFHSK